MPKKPTYTKITDQKKAWNRKKKPKPYRVEQVLPNKTILIVCEGQTEKLYFDAFPVVTLKVTAVDLGGQSKSKLVSMTEMLADQEEYDEIWCVFDMDYKGDVSGIKEDFDNAITKAKELGFHPAYSNDSFELWFYLHFNYTDQRNHRTFYYKKLGQFFNVNYEEEGKRYFFCSQNYERLQNHPDSSQVKAIERAEKLFYKQMDLKYHEQNPVTLIYQLVSELNNHLKE